MVSTWNWMKLMFHSTSPSRKKQFLLNLNVAFDHFRQQKLKKLVYFLTTSVCFTPECSSKNQTLQWCGDAAWKYPVFLAQIGLCTEPRHHSQQTCFKKAKFAQDHPTYAGRMVQAGCGLVQTTFTRPISVTMRGFTSSNLLKPPWILPLGFPWGRWQPEPGPCCSDPAQRARSAGWTSRKPFPRSIGGRDGKVLWGMTEVGGKLPRGMRGQGGADSRGLQKTPITPSLAPMKAQPRQKEETNLHLGL